MTYDELHKQLDEEYDRIIAETLRQLAKKKPLTRQKLAKALFEANKRYWTARLALLDDSAVYDAERIGRIVGTAYSNAAIELSDQVRRVFSGYQSAFNLTRKDAEDLLEHVVYDRSIADNLRTMAAAVPNSEEKTRIMAELSAPAYRYRMQRAEQIAKNAQETLESIAKFEVRTDRTFMQTEIEKAYNISLDEAQRLPPSDAVIIDLSGQSPQNTGYMPRAEEPVRDFTPTTDRGIMDSFTLANDKAVKEIIDHEWKDGNFSERIWSNTDELAREVKQVLLEGELTGASEAKMAAKIEERFQVGMHKARRVVRTESNYCINQAELKGMKDAGFDEYEFISLGEEAEDVCDTCDDLDGQRFKIADAVVGVNCPPMHPFCRCKVTTPQETLEDIQADIDRMLEGTSVEELEQRLDMMIEEKEALPESNSTLNSAQESVEEISGNSENNEELEQVREEQDDELSPEVPINEDVTGKTIGEAEQKAEALGVRHVDYSDLPLKTANTLNEAVNSLPPEARPAYVGSGKHLQEATGAKFQRSEKHYFGVHLDTRSGGGYFRFGEYPNIKYDFEGGEAVGISNAYKDLDKIPDVKEKYNADYAKKHDGHTWYFNTEDGKSVAFHEVGHVYADVKGIPDGFEQDAERWAAESKCDMLKNTNEAWAEAWGAYHTQNPNLPDYIAKYVHERTNTPLDNFGKSGIIGVETTSGVTITELSDHVKQRIAERELTEEGMVDAVKHPLHFRNTVYDQLGRPSQRFIGKSVTVNVNPDTGVIPTAWVTGSDKLKKYGGGDFDE